MYIQFQSTKEEFKKLGSYTSFENAYLNNLEAENRFLEALHDLDIFFVGSKKEIEIIIASAKKTVENSNYYEFTGSTDYQGHSSIPIKGLISFKN